MSLENIGLGAILQFEEKDAVAKVGRFQQAIEGARKGLGQIGSGLGTMRSGASQSFGAIKQIAVPAMIGASAATGLAVAATVRFDDSISKIGTAMGKAEFAKTRGDLEDMAKTMSLSGMRQGPAEIAQAMEGLVKAGVDVKDLKGTLGPVLQMATADGMDAANSTNVLVSALAQFQMPMSGAARAADVLSRAADASKASIGSISEALTYVGPVANAAGLDIEKTAAALAYLDNAGFKGSVGGTHLAAVLESFTSQRHAGWFKELGVAVTDSTGKMRPFMDVVQETNDALNKHGNEQERFVAQERLFGKEGRLAFLALATGGKKAMDELDNKVRNGSVGVAEKADIMAQSFAGMTAQIKNALEVLAITFTQTFGDDLQKGLGSVLGFTKDVVKAFGLAKGGAGSFAFIGLDPTAVAIAQGLAAAIAGVKQALRDAKPYLIGFMQSLTPDRVAMIAKAAGIFALLSPPLLVMMPLLSSAVSLIGGLTTMFSGAFTAGSGLMTVLQSIGGYLADIPGLGWIVAAVFAALSGAWNDLTNVGSSWLLPVFGGLWASIKEMGTAVWDLVKVIGEMLWPLFRIVGSAAVSFVSVALVPLTWAFRLLSLVVSTVVELLAGILHQIGRFFKAIADGVESMKSSLGSLPGMQMFLGSAQVAPSGILSGMREQLGLAQATEAASSRTVANANSAFGMINQIDMRANATAEQRIHNAVEDAKSAAMALFGAQQKQKDLISDAFEVAGEAVGEKIAKLTSDAIAKGLSALNIFADVKSTTVLDGKKVGAGVARAQMELKDRAGSKATPQQRRMILERGISTGGK